MHVDHVDRNVTLSVIHVCYKLSDLLARFQLWTTSNKIIKLCHLPLVSSLNQQSTRIHINCHRCNRPLQRVGWLCDRCKLVINNCSVWWVDNYDSVILGLTNFQVHVLKIISSSLKFCLFFTLHHNRFNNSIQEFYSNVACLHSFVEMEKDGISGDFCKMSYF